MSESISYTSLFNNTRRSRQLHSHKKSDMAFPMLLMRRLVWSSCGPTATFYNITSRHHNKRNKNNSKKESILHLPTCQFHPSKGKALLLLYVMLHSTSSSIKSNTFGIMCGLVIEREMPLSPDLLLSPFYWKHIFRHCWISLSPYELSFMVCTRR